MNDVFTDIEKDQLKQLAKAMRSGRRKVKGQCYDRFFEATSHAELKACALGCVAAAICPDVMTKDIISLVMGEKDVNILSCLNEKFPILQRNMGIRAGLTLFDIVVWMNDLHQWSVGRIAESVEKGEINVT